MPCHLDLILSQLLEGLPEADSERIQTAYFSALDDNFAKFKADATELELWASSKGKVLRSGVAARLFSPRVLDCAWVNAGGPWLGGSATNFFLKV